jgi:hypothetical protein
MNQTEQFLSDSNSCDHEDTIFWIVRWCWLKTPDISEEHVTSIFIVEEQSKQETSKKQAVSRMPVGFLFGLVSYTEHGGNMFSSETSGFLQSIRRYNTEDFTLWTYS